MRDILDRYYTKPDLAIKLVSMLGLGYGITALEPSIVLSKRPSFTGDGKTDGSEYAFFVWEKDKPRQPVEWI